MYNYIEAQKAIDNADTIQKSYPKGVQNKLLRIIKDILINPRSKVTIGNPDDAVFENIILKECAKPYAFLMSG